MRWGDPPLGGLHRPVFHVFMWIRQIFHHTKSSENKVSLTLISEFSKKCLEFQRNLQMRIFAETEENWVFPKTGSNSFKTTETKLSHHQLFIQIRQVFDHVQASKNKVSLIPISAFFDLFLTFDEISWVENFDENAELWNSNFYQFCRIFRISGRLNSFFRWANFQVFLRLFVHNSPRFLQLNSHFMP